MAEADGQSVEHVVARTGRGQHLRAGWERVLRGAARRGGAEDTWRADLAACQLVLPRDARWTHLTAARIRGWWLPPLPRDMPSITAGSRQVRRPGLIGVRRATLTTPDVIEGLIVDSAVDTIISCARDLAELDLLCVVVAALAKGDCSLGELELAASEPARGARNLRRVLPRADHRHESIWEVLLAELHRACGIEVKPQRKVFDDAGRFVARGDLWLVGTNTLHEYDGAGHRDPGQHANDLRRDRRIHRARWVRHGYTRRDVLYSAVHVLADADDAVGRRHDPQRIRRWYAILHDSLFSPPGLAAAARRWTGVTE